MKLVKLSLLIAGATLLVASAPAGAQPLPYGVLTLDVAKKVAAASEAEARKNNWNVVIAVVDAGGHLVMLTRMDDTQIGSVEVARDKAYSAAAFRRPTKAFQDVVASGGAGLRILGLHGASPLEGGVPIVIGGKIVGAVGVSGVTGEQDGQIAKAGTDAVK